MTGSGPGPFVRGGKGHPIPPPHEPVSPAEAPPDPGPGGPVPANGGQPAAPPCGQASPSRQADERRSRPAAAAVRFIRRSSRDEIIARLKHQQREQEAYRIAPDEDSRARPADEAHAGRAVARRRRGWSSTSPPKAASTSGNSCGSWRRSSGRASRCARSASATRPGCSAATARAAGRCAARRGCRSSSRSRSRWPSSRT